MNNKASSLRSSIEEFAHQEGIDAEMDQNLVKEAIHLHLLSAMSDAGVLRHAVFPRRHRTTAVLWRRSLQRGPRLRLRQSRFLFHRRRIQRAHRARTGNDQEDVNRDFGIAADQISLKKPRIRISSSRNRSRWPLGR